MPENDQIQFDERDNVFARRDLQPETPEYDEFYSRHPEWKEPDDNNRTRPEIGSFISDADMGFYEAPAWLMQHIGSPEVVDGSPAPQKVHLSPEAATDKIKNFAKQLGADLVGISSVNQAYVYSNRGRTRYSEEQWGEKIELSHQFAISMGFREDIDLIRTAPGSPELMDTSLTYLRSAIASVVLAEYIRSLGFPARAHHFANYQVLSVPLAIDAGLGELGRCGFLLTKECGNCVRLSTVTSDLSLLCDEPVDIGVQDFCNRCKICADVCPSKSIPMGDKVVVRGTEKWYIDDLKCHTYWTKVGTDCGMCIASCPWTQRNNWMHRTSARLASRSKMARIILLWLHPIIYGKYQPAELPGWFDQRIKKNRWERQPE